MSVDTGTDERALKLLGQGLGPEVVSSALGISVSRISQLLSDPIFTAKVADLRFKSLEKHTARDERYDQMEDKLLEKLENLLIFMTRPLEVIRAISVINAAKRRGVSSPEQINGQQNVVPIVLPTHLMAVFTGPANIQVNIHNQVIKAGDQELVTIQSSALENLVKVIPNERSSNSPSTEIVRTGP